MVPGSRWARTVCGLDERDCTMRSDPVLFTSSRGELERKKINYSVFTGSESAEISFHYDTRY